MATAARRPSDRRSRRRPHEQALADLEQARAGTLALVAPLSDEDLERVHSPIMSPLVWDLGHIAAYEDLWLASATAGLELLRPDLAELLRRVRDAARGARGDRGARAGRRRATTWRPCAPARADGARARRASATGRSARWCSATSSSTPRRCARRWRSPGCSPPGDRRAAEQPLPRPPDASRGVDRRCPPGRLRWAPASEGFAYDNERPRHTVELPRLPDRAPPGQQRELDALQRGRRLRAARVVVARGLGLEAARTTSPITRRWRRATRRARLSRLLVRGRRLRPSARRAPAHRGRVGEGGETSRTRRDFAHGDAHWRRRAGVGVDRRHASTATRGSSPTPTASTPRCSSARTTACCAAARGRRTRASRARPSATGTCPSAGRSSPACGSRKDHR